MGFGGFTVKVIAVVAYVDEIVVAPANDNTTIERKIAAPILTKDNISESENHSDETFRISVRATRL